MNKQRKIDVLKVKPTLGEFENVVEVVTYTHKFVSASIGVFRSDYHTLDTSSLDVETFIELDDLTDDIVYGWVSGSITGSIWEELEAEWEVRQKPAYVYKPISSSFKPIV